MIFKMYTSKHRILKRAEKPTVPHETTKYLCEVCVLGIVGTGLENQHVSIDASRCFTYFRFVDNIHLEKVAYGHYSDKEKLGNTDFSSCLTRLTWKKAPAATITSSKNNYRIIK